MKRLTPQDMPDWPRLMQRPYAAAYMGVSPSTFDRKFQHIKPVPGLGGNRVWDRHDLDAEIERCKATANGENMADENSANWDDVLVGSLKICPGRDNLK